MKKKIKTIKKNRRAPSLFVRYTTAAVRYFTSRKKKDERKEKA